MCIHSDLRQLEAPCRRCPACLLKEGVRVRVNTANRFIRHLQLAFREGFAAFRFSDIFYKEKIDIVQPISKHRLKRRFVCSNLAVNWVLQEEQTLAAKTYIRAMEPLILFQHTNESKCRCLLNSFTHFDFEPVNKGR